MSVAGTYDCVTKSPMGDQKSTFTVVPGDDGKTFTGTNQGSMGSHGSRKRQRSTATS